MGCKRFCWLVAVFAFMGVDRANAALTTNSWTTTGSGFWQTAGNWSVGVPAATQAVILVTNALTKTVTINSATPAGNLTISNLTIRGLGAGTNTLQITNAPGSTLLIHNQLTVGTNAVLLLTNSTLQVDGDSLGIFMVDGVVTFDSGTIIANTASLNTSIGNVGRGIFTMKAGTMLSTRMIAGSTAGNPGTFTIAGGTNTIDTQLNIAFAANSTGMVWVTGGLLDVVNDRTDVGGLGTGALTISNGFYRTKAQNIGLQGRGTLTVAGGTNVVNTGMSVGTVAGATGTVWLTAGRLIVTNGQMVVGESGVGQFTTSNGTFIAKDLIIASNNTARGTWNIAGGTNSVFSRFTVANATNSIGSIIVTGGQLLHTNTSFTCAVGSGGSGTMTVSNGATRIEELVIGSGVAGNGNLTIAGGTNVLSALVVSGSSAATGNVLVTGSGRLVVTNAPALTDIGQFGVAQMTVSNGTVLAGNVAIGFLSGGRGTLTIAGGMTALTGPLTLGANAGSSGTLKITGGSLVVTNTPATVSGGLGFIVDGDVFLKQGQIIATNVFTVIGNRGFGSLTVSNGSFVAGNVTVGELGNHATGTLTFAGGTNRVTSTLALGASTSTGTVWLTGGLLLTTNALTIVGQDTAGAMTVSNATWLARNIVIASDSASRGTLTIAAGTTTVSSNLSIGAINCGTTGLLNIVGGTLAVTNAAGTAVLDIESGTLTQTGGTLIMDNLVITNPCARFIKTGGSFVIKTTIAFDPNGDADGDGLPNQYEIDNGLLLFDPRDAAADKDGDGQSNLAEFLASTSPTNSASSFQITSVVRTGNNLRVTWMMGPGKMNALERSPGDASGSFSTNFTAIFTVTNTVGTTTNFLDVGGATNKPARYYRVRLVP